MKSFRDFEEKNVEKAIQKACADLNITKDKLKYDIISHGSSGIFGLVGAKKALIRVFVSEQPKDCADVGGLSNRHQRDDSSEADRLQSDKISINALVDEAFGEIPETKPKEKSNKKQSAPKTESPSKKETPDKAEDTAVRSSSSNQSFDNAESYLEDNNDSAIAVAQELILQIFRSMSVDAQLSIHKETNQSVINVKVPEPGILIGKRGQTLEAIQYLMDKVVNKQCGKWGRVIVDVEGYVESRKSELKDLASRLANKAVKTGKPSTITRMNAHDRRIVHVSLKKNRSVRTKSVGDGYYRKLIIIPKKKSPKKTGNARSNNKE